MDRDQQQPEAGGKALSARHQRRHKPRHIRPMRQYPPGRIEKGMRLSEGRSIRRLPIQVVY